MIKLQRSCYVVALTSLLLLFLPHNSIADLWTLSVYIPDSIAAVTLTDAVNCEGCKFHDFLSLLPLQTTTSRLLHCILMWWKWSGSNVFFQTKGTWVDKRTWEFWFSHTLVTYLFNSQLDTKRTDPKQAVGCPLWLHMPFLISPHSICAKFKSQFSISLCSPDLCRGKSNQKISRV